MWKKLLPIPFVILALVALYAGLRRSAPSSAPDPSAAPSASAAPLVERPRAPAGSASGEVIVLTPKEREEISVPIAHEKCGEMQERWTQMGNPPPHDPKGLRFLAACMRHGNVAWYRCASAAHTRPEVNACSHRLLFHELAP